jgi:kynureninase
VLCDFRPDAGIRLGPHYYSTDGEIRFAIEQIADILESGVFRSHAGVVARH